MNQRDNRLRIAVVGDLHMHEDHAGRFKDIFLRMAAEAEVLLLCGDLTNTGLLEEARHLARDLEEINKPVLAVLGNHDHENGTVEELKKTLKEAGVIFLDEEQPVINNVGFAGVKGFGGGFGSYMLGSFGEEAIKKFVAESLGEAMKLENQLQSLRAERIVVAMHYLPVLETAKGEPPEIYPFLGSSRFMETIDRFRIAAVFHGHAHRGAFEGKTPKGTPVYNTCLELLQKKQNRDFLVVEI